MNEGEAILLVGLLVGWSLWSWPLWVVLPLGILAVGTWGYHAEGKLRKDRLRYEVALLKAKTTYYEARAANKGKEEER